MVKTTCPRDNRFHVVYDPQAVSAPLLFVEIKAILGVIKDKACYVIVGLIPGVAFG